MEKYYKKIGLIFLVFLIVNINFISSFPAEKQKITFSNDIIDQEQTNVNNAIFIYNDKKVAQSFTPTLPEITRVELYLSKNGEITSDLKLIIKENLLGPTIREVSISSDKIPSGQPEWIEFNFLNIDNDNDVYYIICETDSGDESNYYEVYSYTLDLYENGIVYLKNNISTDWTQESDIDLAFKTYGAGPILNIQYVKGLPAGKISIGIKNIGTSAAENIVTTASFDGGIFLRRFFQEEANNSLEPDDEIQFIISPIIGIGISELYIYITSDNSEIIEEKRDVFVLFFYIYVKQYFNYNI